MLFRSIDLQEKQLCRHIALNVIYETTSSPDSLKGKAQGKLNLAGCGGRLGNPARRAGSSPGAARENDCGGAAEIGVVGKIEQVGPELQPSLGVEEKFSLERYVHVEHAGSNERVAAGGAEGSRRRRRESAGIEIHLRSSQFSAFAHAATPG